MKIDSLSQHQLNELELKLKDLLAVLRKAKLYEDPLVEELRALELEVAELRRQRFDVSNPEYRGF
ncbi:MAG: hypothetical protein IT320_04595 [Anaerolineae bacterium]|nr:hypothetical protein [Anaerolineae bacterium]